MTERAVIERPLDDVFATTPDAAVTVARFCGDVMAAVGQLPRCRHLVNLCQSRYGFMVVFFAAAVSGRITLLPGRRDAAMASELAARYPDCRSVADEASIGADATLAVDPGTHGDAPVPVIDDAAVVAIAFTSGSTGEPRPHRKTWAMFGGWRQVHWRHVPEALRQPARVVATVPPWHMYGLEWSMLLPTLAPLVVHCGADFYPRDVIAAIDGWEGSTVLVSTPLHLRALVRVPPPAGKVAFVVSATAPLEAPLVAAVESGLRTTLFEIYGCSEIGSLAWRCPGGGVRQGQDWHFFDCFESGLNEGIVTIAHAELPEPVVLPDLFSAGDQGGLRLLGRAGDVVKVGGKRESLARLNTLLATTPGVEDGVFYLPETFGLAATGRLGALVVAPGLDARELRTRLAMRIDPVFLPRPLHLVEGLPRDATSKLRHTSLKVMLESLGA